MFEKLLAALPYNPSLIHQLGFYAKRMRREETVRRTGLIFIVLSFFVQFFAVVAPPQPTVAYSTNDMINNGFTSQAGAVSNCRNDVKSYGSALANFGISCDDVARATIVPTLSSTSYGKQLYSMGWLSYGPTNLASHKTTGQVAINLTGVAASNNPLYARFLWSFDTGDHSDYQALKVISSVTHKTYFILFSCGNLVAVGVPVPLSRCQYNQTILANNTQCYKPCQYNTTIPASSPSCFQPCKYNKTFPANSSQCFAPCPLPGKGNLPQSSSQCIAACPYNNKLPANSSSCFQPCQYNSTISSSSSGCYLVCQYNSSLPANSPGCFQPCKYNSSVASSSSACKPCEQAVSSQDTLACLQISKTASNQTESIANADNTTAQAGDIIVYTLHAANNGKATISQYVMAENISDVLDYATVKDLNGATIDSNNLVSWPAEDIAAGVVETHTITVIIKDPIPNTPPDPADPGHFDHIMTNVYGNAVNISLPGTPITAVVAATTALPNTGPGSSLILAGAIVVVAGYFFARARLLTDESLIAVRQSANYGGA